MCKSVLIDSLSCSRAITWLLRYYFAYVQTHFYRVIRLLMRRATFIESFSCLCAVN